MKTKPMEEKLMKPKTDSLRRCIKLIIFLARLTRKRIKEISVREEVVHIFHTY
jgi:hypothetical protein